MRIGHSASLSPEKRKLKKQSDGILESYFQRESARPQRILIGGSILCGDRPLFADADRRLADHHAFDAAHLDLGSFFARRSGL